MSGPVPSADQQEERLVLLEEAPAQDRRSANRAAARGMSLVREEGRAEAQSARIKDISATGIALLVNSRYPDGTVLTIAPLGWRATEFLVAKVVHSRPILQGWLHGCEFDHPLAPSDLELWHSYYCRQGL